MGFNVAVLADSVNLAGCRLTTFELTFPRFILAELNTHRMLSRNSASSRAIPPEKLVDQVQSDPFVPLTFNRRVNGMGVGEELNEFDAVEAEKVWLEARDHAVNGAWGLMGLDVDKSRINRLLEPFMWHTAIVSATDWENFFALRNSNGAQPEFKLLAAEMERQYRTRIPDVLRPGEWHLPLVGSSDAMQTWADVSDILYAAKASAGRCARVSFDRHHDYENINESAARWERLAPMGHWSPGEHPAMAMDHADYIGNFRGFRQLRKFYDGEDDYSNFKED